MATVDLSKTLEELEGDDWGTPQCDSHLVVACHRLRRLPLRDLGVQDLRIMIEQGVGLPFLVPLAVDLLGKDALRCSELYSSDLLVSVLSVEPDFWNRNPRLRQSLAVLVRDAKERLGELPVTERKAVRDALEHFC